MKVLRILVIVAIVAGVGALMAYMIIASMGWTDIEKEAFVEQCVASATRDGRYTEDFAQDYCTCMLDKTVQTYSNYEEAEAGLTLNHAQEWAGQCLEYADSVQQSSSMISIAE